MLVFTVGGPLFRSLAEIVSVRLVDEIMDVALSYHVRRKKYTITNGTIYYHCFVTVLRNSVLRIVFFHC